MMPVIRISDAAFDSLKLISKWLETKTPSQTIEEIVRQKMDELGFEHDQAAEQVTGDPLTDALQFDHTPGLSFTKPMSATVNGVEIHNPRWSSILFATIEQLKAKGFAGEGLARELHIPAKVGEHVDEGFKNHPTLGVSIQGQSASDAWKEIDRIAKKWRIPVAIKFKWRHNPKAQFPGRVGVLRSGDA